MPRKISHATMVRRRDKARSTREFWEDYVESVVNRGTVGSWELKTIEEYDDFHKQIRNACVRLDYRCKTSPSQPSPYRPTIWVTIRTKLEQELIDEENSERLKKRSRFYDGPQIDTIPPMMGPPTQP